MASLNRIQLIGNLGKDPELRYTKTQTPFVRFSLATTEEYTVNGERQKKTQWHNLVIWGKQAEIADKYLRKGRQIYAEGKVEYREYDDQSGNRRNVTDVKVDRFIMLDSRYAGGQSASPSQSSDAGSSGGADYEVPESDSFNDDDIPF